MKNSVILIFLLFIAASCSDRDLKKAEKTINVADLAEYVSKLGSDEFMGRKPFTAGEKITIEYLAAQLKRIGFEPAFGDSYFQPVPMVEIASLVEGPVVTDMQWYFFKSYGSR